MRSTFTAALMLCLAIAGCGDASVSNITIAASAAHAASKVTWKLIRSDDRGDWYRFERTFPYGETNAQTTQCEVVFEGSEIVVFEDDVQRVIMRPGGTHLRAPGT